MKKLTFKDGDIKFQSIFLSDTKFTVIADYFFEKKNNMTLTTELINHYNVLISYEDKKIVSVYISIHTKDLNATTPNTRNISSEFLYRPDKNYTKVELTNTLINDKWTSVDSIDKQKLTHDLSMMYFPISTYIDVINGIIKIPYRTPTEIKNLEFPIEITEKETFEEVQKNNELFGKILEPHHS